MKRDTLEKRHDQARHIRDRVDDVRAPDPLAHVVHAVGQPRVVHGPAPLEQPEHGGVDDQPGHVDLGPGHAELPLLGPGHDGGALRVRHGVVGEALVPGHEAVGHCRFCCSYYLETERLGGWWFGRGVEGYGRGG